MYVRYQVTLVSDGRWKQRGCANISLVFLRQLLVRHEVQQPEKPSRRQAGLGALWRFGHRFVSESRRKNSSRFTP